MHRWESTLKYYTKLEKLLLSVENFIIKEELLITIATEICVLEKFVHFTKQIEYTDHDVSLFLEQTEDVHSDPSRLLRRPGKHFKMMTERLKNGNLKA